MSLLGFVQDLEWLFLVLLHCRKITFYIHKSKCLKHTFCFNGQSVLLRLSLIGLLVLTAMSNFVQSVTLCTCQHHVFSMRMHIIPAIPDWCIFIGSCIDTFNICRLVNTTPCVNLDSTLFIFKCPLSIDSQASVPALHYIVSFI